MGTVDKTEIERKTLSTYTQNTTELRENDWSVPTLTFDITQEIIIKDSVSIDPKYIPDIIAVLTAYMEDQQ